MDRLTAQQRSLNMAKIKSKNTKPELIVFNILDSLKISYEKHFDIYGKPDVAFPNQKVAVFINGEFWHGRHYRREKDRYPTFWIEKIRNNMSRDRKNYRLLKAENWQIIKIWDKDIKKHTVREVNKIMKVLNLPLVRKSDLKI